jgi:predicted PurR-regulated permease PerM
VRSDTSRDITRITLLVLVIGALLVGSLWTLRPFLSGLIWATAIAITTRPLLLRLQQLTGRRSVAAAVLTLLVLLTFIVPFALAINTLLDAASQSPAVLNDFFANRLGLPPQWIAKIGPLPVLAIGMIWLYWTGSATLGTGLLIWSAPVLMLDNVLRPMLIRRGVKLPLLLIIGGVIGGLIGFGVVGLFVGPVVLATTFTLTKDWVARGHADTT